jgi:hypothetical protein
VVLVVRTLLRVVLLVAVARDLVRAGGAGWRATGPGEEARLSAPAA